MTTGHCRRCNARGLLIESLEGQIAHHRAQAQQYQEAITTLDSERAANAALTAENEALRGANDSLATAAILPDHLVLVERGEVEALRADAERYRLWRSDYTDAASNDSDSVSPMLMALADAWTPEEVDAAIDAARSKA